MLLELTELFQQQQQRHQATNPSQHHQQHQDGKAAHTPSSQQPQQQQQQPQQPSRTTLQHPLMGHHHNHPSLPQMGGGMEHRRSPVNHLAKWFGPDLLKQPMGQIPPTIPSGQKILSVEELERQQQQQQVVG